MPRRLRKLIGAVALIAFVAVYSLVAMTIAIAKLPEAAPSIQLAYGAIAGLLWIVPAGAIIGWMQRP